MLGLVLGLPFLCPGCGLGSFWWLPVGSGVVVGGACPAKYLGFGLLPLS